MSAFNALIPLTCCIGSLIVFWICFKANPRGEVSNVIVGLIGVTALALALGSLVVTLDFLVRGTA